METKIAVLITAMLACVTWNSVDAARGFIFTCPRSMEQNAVNQLHLSLHDVNAAGNVTVTLLTPHDDKRIAQVAVDVESGESEKVINFLVPETTEYEGKIIVEGFFDTTDGYSFFDQDKVNFHSANSIIIFTQTDKPLYKPGQKVMFRVLPVDRTLRPLGENTIGDVWVEDTVGSRIAQWKNVSLGEGIRQFELPLSEEPVLGLWKISVSLGKIMIVLHFEVREYVLPKFEVIIKSPPYVLADSEIIPLEICAKYTYGKLVDGTLKINSSLESYSWSYDKFPVLEFEGRIEGGCFNYDLNVSLVDKEYNYVYRKIQIFAEVTEDGTDIKRNNTEYIERTQNPLKLSFVENTEYFKPGLPTYGKVKVTRPDDSPAPKEDVQVCATISRERILQRWWATRKVKFCRNYTSDVDGIIAFEVPPQKADAVSVSLDAKSIKYGESSGEPGRPALYKPQSSSYFQPWYSPSKSHIQVQRSGDIMECGKHQTVRILYNAKVGETYNFYYQVISKGKVVYKGSKEVTFTADDDITESICSEAIAVNSVEIPLVPPVTKEQEDEDVSEDAPCGNRAEGIYIGATELDLDVSPSFSPAVQLLVYYIRSDAETVADSAKFKVEKCFQNKVDLQFGDSEKQPGTKTTVTVKASPNSLCGIKILDKSISLLDSSDQLSKDKVFTELQRFDSGQYYSRNHCNSQKRKGGRSKIAQSSIISTVWSSSPYVDTVTAFENTGLVVMSDLTLLTRPCKRSNSYENYGGIAMASVGVRGGGASMAELAPAPQSASAFSATSDDARRQPMNDLSAAKQSSSATKSYVEVRNYFPETWLFDLLALGESGEKVTKETLPHTITEWVGSAVCINSADGLGLSDVSSIRGFQAFFLSFTLPYSVIRGEKLPVVVTIFNYLEDCLPITVSLEDSEGTGGYTLSNQVTETDYCVCGGKSVTHTFQVIPTIVGTLNITVSGRTSETPAVCGDNAVASVVARDSATVQLLVEAEGFPQEKVNSMLFCPEDYENSLFKETLKLDLPASVVPDSARAYISVSGDIMGPAIDGLDRLVRLPTGCGEQNMVLFVPNIVVLDYMTSVGKLTDKIKSKAVTNLQKGYQRELKYRHPDGSFSAFGVSDKEGSTWLSAFVLKSFSQAKKYIDIDNGDIQQTTRWIVSKQESDGCFREGGRVLQQGMKGGVSSNRNSSAPLTAYILSALITAGYENDTLVDLSLSCMEAEANLTPYTAALFAYAASLANSSKADTYIEQLLQKAVVSGDETFWKNVNGSASLDVETASYAILALLKRKGDESLMQVLSIVRRLTRMRNANGGFVSTQDTVIGLEAIAAFASIISQDPVSLTVTMKNDVLNKEIVVTEDDKILVKKDKISVLPAQLDIEATGTGCGLIQTTLRYNTVDAPKLKFFSIDVRSERLENCKVANMIICVSYLPENKKSNMALVEVKMLSGFVASKDSLDKLTNDASVKLKRYDINNNVVVLYFDELTNDEKCFTFEAEEITAVEDIKPSTAKVYDYYAKEKEESTEYTISGTC